MIMTSEQKRTPCEKLGYKVGDVFKVLKGELFFVVGDIITLQRDDGTQAPQFKGKDNIMQYEFLDNIKKIENQGTL